MKSEDLGHKRKKRSDVGPRSAPPAHAAVPLASLGTLQCYCCLTVFNTRTSTTLTKHFEGSPECSQGEHYAVKARIDGFREAERVAMATGRLEEAQEERAASAAAAEDAAPEAEADLEEMDVDSSPPRGGVDDSHDEGAAGGGSDDGGGGGGERPASPRLVEAVEARGGEGGAETATEEEQMPVVGPSLSAAAAGAAAASGGGSSGAGTAAGAAVDVSSSEEAMAAAVASLSAARDTEAEEWLVQEIDRERELLDGQTSEEEGEDVQGEEEEEEESEKEGAELVDGLDSAAGDEERAKAAKRQREEWLDAVASTCGGRIEGIYKEIASFSDYEWLCFHHCQGLSTAKVSSFWKILKENRSVERLRWTSLKAFRAALGTIREGWKELKFACRDERPGKAPSMHEFPLHENPDWVAGELIQRLVSRCHPEDMCFRPIYTGEKKDVRVIKGFASSLRMERIQEQLIREERFDPTRGDIIAILAPWMDKVTETTDRSKSATIVGWLLLNRPFSDCLKTDAFAQSHKWPNAKKGLDATANRLMSSTAWVHVLEHVRRWGTEGLMVKFDHKDGLGERLVRCWAIVGGISHDLREVLLLVKYGSFCEDIRTKTAQPQYPLCGTGKWGSVTVKEGKGLRTYHAVTARTAELRTEAEAKAALADYRSLVADCSRAGAKKLKELCIEPIDNPFFDLPCSRAVGGGYGSFCVDEMHTVAGGLQRRLVSYIQATIIGLFKTQAEGQRFWEKLEAVYEMVAEKVPGAPRGVGLRDNDLRMLPRAVRFTLLPAVFNGSITIPAAQAACGKDTVINLGVFGTLTAYLNDYTDSILGVCTATFADTAEMDRLWVRYKVFALEVLGPEVMSCIKAWLGDIFPLMWEETGNPRMSSCALPEADNHNFHVAIVNTTRRAHQGVEAMEVMGGNKLLNDAAAQRAAATAAASEKETVRGVLKTCETTGKPAVQGKRTPPGLHGAALGPALVAGLSDAEALAPCVTCAVPAAAAAGGAISKVNTFSIGAIPCSRGPATVRGRAGTIYGAPTCTPVILGAPGTPAAYAEVLAILSIVPASTGKESEPFVVLRHYRVMALTVNTQECLTWAVAAGGGGGPVVSCVPMASITGLPTLVPDCSGRAGKLVVRWGATATIPRM